MKKVTIIKSSFRNKSNSNLLTDKFIDGLKVNNNVIKVIELKSLNLKFCNGCLACSKLKKCVINDDMNYLYDEISNSDVLVFASPIYYYDVSGQLKTFLDRLNPLFFRDNKFKEVYLILTSAEEDNSTMDVAISSVNGWISCFENLKLVDVIKGLGVNEEKEILSHQDLLDESCNLGKSIR